MSAINGHTSPSPIPHPPETPPLAILADCAVASPKVKRTPYEHTQQEIARLRLLARAGAPDQSLAIFRAQYPDCQATDASVTATLAWMQRAKPEQNPPKPGAYHFSPTQNSWIEECAAAGVSSSKIVESCQRHFPEIPLNPLRAKVHHAWMFYQKQQHEHPWAAVAAAAALEEAMAALPGNAPVNHNGDAPQPPAKKPHTTHPL